MNGACDGAYITEECDYVQTGQNRTFLRASGWLGKRLNSIFRRRKDFLEGHQEPWQRRKNVCVRDGKMSPTEESDSECSKGNGLCQRSDAMFYSGQQSRRVSEIESEALSQTELKGYRQPQCQCQSHVDGLATSASAAIKVSKGSRGPPFKIQPRPTHSNLDPIKN